MEKLQPTNIAEDIVKWDSHLGKIAWQFFKMLSIELSYDLEILLLGIYPREMKTYVHAKACIQIFTVALITVAKEVGTIQMFN